MAERALTLRQPWPSLVMAPDPAAQWWRCETCKQRQPYQFECEPCRQGPRATSLVADGPARPIVAVLNRSRPVPTTLPPWWRCQQCDERWYSIVPAGQRVPRSLWHDHTNGEVCGGAITRDGPFPFRLWIHVGQRRDDTAPAHAWERADLARVSLHRQVYGVLLGSVEVTGQHHADECDRRVGGVLRSLSPDVLADERAHCSPFAEPDRWHITLADPRPLPQPIPCRGRQGWWRLPDDVAEQVRAKGAAL